MIWTYRLAAVIATLGLAAGAPAAAQNAGPAAGAPSPPQVVLSTMHQVNQLEMRLAQAAEERGTAEAVRRYGDRLFRDHRFADTKVTALAGKLGVDLLPPPQLPAAPKLKMFQQQAQQLQQASGAASTRTTWS